ncbi:SMI1/KNR4 family protein [Carboxylicivirga linearis]|uniref:SMI1/KNR4 family protein n=1 Tax=Carboxylicivirga linearis TaxID=1628157 RepID=A0ABS5K1K3_9BACT|nr:SMI1/KNR4 family protein [Carboxylicivirga linearis]MBS2101029.1 SMI1/KNR4 family protein [Carboxylicivirga linearis]
MKIIEEFIDESIERLKSPKFDIFYLDKEDVPSMMVDQAKPERNDELAWKPIKSTVTDSDLEYIENKIGYKYPDSYKYYLKYKHFFELANLSSILLFRHMSDSWKEVLLEQIFDGWPKEDVLERGLIPFADYEDWGLVCFNTTKLNSDGEFQIYVWDHEQSDSEKYLANSFYDMIHEIMKNIK